ncbi:MAG: division/cell wall cluster transcriptional repressor MraZ [Chloroflexi bacterium]|nr:division/cell wall cluster transcriptional repressor MraZ [Chloroflexota bacterium]MBI2979452.1 division/cell wall cluster transcriptional repressor MraZ [Chloroflexota bacterium]
MFLGEFEYRIDEKGRVLIPPRFRRELKDGVVLAPGAERCINVYSLVEWKKLAASLTTGSAAPSKLRRLNRAIFATAFTLYMDGQGRIAVPAPLREYAGIEDEAVIAGANTYLELWNKEQWESEKAISQEQVWQIIESLERH